MIPRIVALMGVLAALALVVPVIWGGAVYPNYDHLRQFISELGATGAVTAPIVNSAFIVSGVLTVLFWIGAMVVLPRTALTVIGGSLSALSGVFFGLAGIYACDFGCTRSDQTPAAVLHDLHGGLAYLTAIMGMAVLAFASVRWPGARLLKPLGLTCTAISMIGFYGVVAEPELAGLLQRLTEGAMWIFLLATAGVVYGLPKPTMSEVI